MKTVYIAVSSDTVLPGHINIIEQGAKLGEVTIGLLTDEAIAHYKRLPSLLYHERERIFGALKHVARVVPQTTLDYSENLDRLRPNYVVHGDDWKIGVQSLVREKVITTLAAWGGELV